MRLTWLRFRRELVSDWLSFQNESTFRGHVFIGGHTGQPETRYLLSLDPAVNFFDKVDGYGPVEGIYTLDARAIGFDTSVLMLSPDDPRQPVVNFARDVGSARALAGVNAQTAIVPNMQGLRGASADTVGGVGARQQASIETPTSTNAGTVRFTGNITTTGGQTYFANRFVVSGGGTRGNEFNGTSFDMQLGSGGIVNGDGGRPRIRFSTNPTGETLRQLQRAGAVITSLPDDSVPHSVSAKVARQKHASQVMDDLLESTSSALPTVEVGDLSEEQCDRDARNECKIPLPLNVGMRPTK